LDFCCSDKEAVTFPFHSASIPLETIMMALILKPVIKPDPNKLDEAYELMEDFGRSRGRARPIFYVPKFFQFDGASIPAAFWQAIGTPFNPRFMVASVIHDWLYHTHRLSKAETDNFFRRLLLVDLVPKWKADLMHLAVSKFGKSYWKNGPGDYAYIARLTKAIIADKRDPRKYGLPPIRR
jgi:hypothetical protein